MNPTTAQEDRFALATHFYVRLKRHANRVVDAVWMAQNDEYAREIIRLARTHGHPELEILADRFEDLMKGVRTKPPADRTPPTPARIERDPVAGHYIGALR